MIDESLLVEFQVLLLNWFENNRRFFPWRYTFDPYLVFVSEILLQQTNSEKVVEPYNKITNEYKNIIDLSNANHDFLEDIFKDIGLLYRASRIISIAKEVVNKHECIFPNDLHSLMCMKGIGRYISSAILCFGYNKPYAILDTNVIRLFRMLFNITSTSKRPHTDIKLWNFTQAILPHNNYVDYNYALLDFAACVCTANNPKCQSCELRFLCTSFICRI
jgi:A/G-specific adenine glycosylase